jgi:hypothetical protein
MSTFEEDSAMNFLKSFRKLPEEWLHGTIWEDLAYDKNYMTDDELSRAICDISNNKGITLHEKYTA